MNSILCSLKGFIAAIARDFCPALKDFCQLSLKNLCPCFCKKQGKAKRHSCTHVAHPSFKRPDPMIYDQYYLMSLGLAVTWQNPDIQILHNGVPVPSAYDLKTSTTYQICATIYNASTEGIVYNMPVVFRYLSFGIGTKSNPIPGPSRTVTLGVKGTPEAVKVVEMDWTTPSKPGHYCIQVSFSYFDDLNPFNNLGQENTQVLQAASPVKIAFQLRNSAHVRKEFRFALDTFQIPPQPPCSEPGSRQTQLRIWRHGVPEPVRQRNFRANHPLPSSWAVTFTPDNPVLAPDEEITVKGTISPPDTFHGTLPVNIHAFSGATLVGGMTMIVNRA
jgi:hypothetical protein